MFTSLKTLVQLFLFFVSDTSSLVSLYLFFFFVPLTNFHGSHINDRNRNRKKKENEINKKENVHTEKKRTKKKNEAKKS